MQISELNNRKGKRRYPDTAHRKTAEIQTALKEIMRKQNCRVRENSLELGGETKQNTARKGKCEKKKGKQHTHSRRKCGENHKSKGAMPATRMSKQP